MEVFIKEPWANPTVYMVKHNITHLYFKQKVSIGKSDKTVYLTMGERFTIPWSNAKDSAGQEQGGDKEGLQGGSGSPGSNGGSGTKEIVSARNYL